MGELVDRVRSLALALGGPGLALVAFLDSTFLPLPGITIKLTPNGSKYEVRVKGPTVTTGYHGDEAKNERVFG